MAGLLLVVVAGGAERDRLRDSIGAALALKSGKASVAQGIFPLVFVILFLSSAYFPRELLLRAGARRSPSGTR